ncbi:hypothetical protein ACHAW6_005213 [Cyclotella cf. meneghiniana]
MTQFFGLCVAIVTVWEANAFFNVVPFNRHVPLQTSTAQFMGRKVKPTMSERRKRRAKRTSSDSVLDTFPTFEKNHASQPTSPPQAVSAVSEKATCVEADETIEKASSLVELQRKSVASLTFIRKRVEEIFPVSIAVQSLANQGYFVHDGFLCPNAASGESANEDAVFGDELLNEMFAEGFDMLSSDKLDRDITRLGDGEFVGLITGGEKYKDCPRLTEYVVSMTRHLPPLLNKIADDLNQNVLPKLDATASMGSLRMYDRPTRVGTESFFVNKDYDDIALDRSFGVICGHRDDATNDSRRITAILFLSSKNWDPSTCGGGITIENGETIGAVRDRLVLLRSDTCFHRQDSWKGSDERDLQQSGCITVHFVKELGSV